MKPKVLVIGGSYFAGVYDNLVVLDADLAAVCAAQAQPEKKGTDRL